MPAMAFSFQQNDRSPDTGNVYAWLCRDDDGVEGVIATPVAGVILALADTDLGRVRRMEPFALETARERGFPAELVRFKRDETLATVGP